MGGSYEKVVQDTKDVCVQDTPKSKSPQKIRLHESGGQVHFHADADGLKNVVSVSQWWSAWQSLKSGSRPDWSNKDLANKTELRANAERLTAGEWLKYINGIVITCPPKNLYHNGDDWIVGYNPEHVTKIYMDECGLTREEAEGDGWTIVPRLSNLPIYDEEDHVKVTKPVWQWIVEAEFYAFPLVATMNY